MHIVTVEDPWFGAYLRLQVPWESGEGTFLQVTLGPLFLRTLRLESLENQGTRMRRRGFNEKPCQHSYVEGTVIGTAAPPPYVFREWYGSFSDWEQTQVNVSTYTTQTFTCKVVKDEPEGIGAGTLVVTFSGITRTGMRRPYVYSEFVDEVEISYRKSEDPRTGNISYDLFQIQRSSGLPANPPPTLETVGCPYGASQDNLGDQLLTIQDWIGKTVGLLPPIQARRNVRDVALFEAIENLELCNINWLTDFVDLAEPLALLRQLGKFFSGGWGWKEILRKLANLHLFWKYVVKCNALTVHEVGRLLHVLTSNWGRIRRAIMSTDMVGHGDAQESYLDKKGNNVSVRYTAKVVYGPDLSSFDALEARIKLLGLLPTVGDLWDMIPYSFVVDWLLPVQDTIDHIEEMNAQQRLPLLYCMVGRKTEQSIVHTWKVNTHVFTLSLRVVNYSRTVLRELPSDMWLGVTFGDLRKRWLTASALVIQRFL